MDEQQEIWDFLDRHLNAIFSGDWEAYQATTAADLSLYEYWILPHRQDGLDFHQFMIQNRWSGRPTAQRYDLFEKRCQRYGDTAVVTYTFMLSQAFPDGLRHRAHNETRVLVKQNGEWNVVHVHKSPCTWPPAANSAGHP
ncbi:MAG: nuclear transport factor 2 family protein [bacterium]|nr:nuclear transport factor 2 family protein [bacterium]